MTCKIISHESAVFAVWGQPTLGDVDEVLGCMRAAEKDSGRRVVYITRVPVDAPPPKGDVRHRLDAAMPAMQAVCASYHVILEGEGFISAFKRAILASLMQNGWPRDSFFVHATPEQAVLKVPSGSLADAKKVLKLAEQQGMLTGPAPVDPPSSRLGRASRA